MVPLNPVVAVEYAFTLGYLHTKLLDHPKLPANSISELWKIQSALGLEESQYNTSPKLRKDITRCYVTLLQMYEEEDDG